MIVELMAHRDAQPIAARLAGAVPLPELLRHVGAPGLVKLDHRVALAAGDDALEALEVELVGLDPQLLVSQEGLVFSSGEQPLVELDGCVHPPELSAVADVQERRLVVLVELKAYKRVQISIILVVPPDAERDDAAIVRKDAPEVPVSGEPRIER